MSSPKALLLGFADSTVQARPVADLLGLPYAEVAVHRFPDGENRLTLPENVAEHVIVFRSLDRPHDKLIELLLVSRTLTQGGVRRLTLVAPYLCYMRQDIAFHPGEVVSQRIIGRWLAELFDDVVTVDPHLHRIRRLEQAVPARRAVTLSATPLLAEYLARQSCRRQRVLLGPDVESGQWVEAMAQAAGLPYVVARKTRRGDRSVRIELPAEAMLEGKCVVLLDDMASTGQTLAVAAEQAFARGAAEVRALVTHALFAGDSLERLGRSGITEVGSSDSIPHPTNVVPLAPLLAGALRSIGLSAEDKRRP